DLGVAAQELAGEAASCSGVPFVQDGVGAGVAIAYPSDQLGVADQRLCVVASGVGHPTSFLRGSLHKPGERGRYRVRGPVLNLLEPSQKISRIRVIAATDLRKSGEGGPRRNRRGERTTWGTAVGETDVDTGTRALDLRAPWGRRSR